MNHWAGAHWARAHWAAAHWTIPGPAELICLTAAIMNVMGGYGIALADAFGGYAITVSDASFCP